MYLVLCADNDLPALWACQKLRETGLAPTELVTASSLALAKRWEHRLGSAGIHLELDLNDGRHLSSSRLRGVLNRLECAPNEIIKHVVAEDREYVAAELGAFFLSWLNALPGVINRPMPQGLAGTWRHSSEWALLAANAGLEIPPYRQSSTSRPEDGYASLAPPGAAIRQVIVLRGELYGAPVPSDLQQPCCYLAESAGTDLLGLELFDSGNGRLTFGHATPVPDLTLGGDDLIEALGRALRNGQRS